MTNLLELAHQIAAALGPGWSAERGYMIHAHAILHGPGDQALSIRHGDASHRRTDHGRLKISPDYGELNRHLNSGEGWTTITVAADRSATTIAAEITRRLLPDYTTTLGLCRTRARAAAELESARQTTRHALHQTLQPARLVYDDLIDFGDTGEGIRGNIRVMPGSTVTFDLTLAHPAALELAQAIAALRAGGRTAA
ncbi:hypothetical protein [Nocardia brasiliensis]|uniref:hypothetical protein n=1 Tax=Nocardia brasiliensis TaxID=37326 RepID=UPI0004A743E5|nr:hypothetical protein [Nocardia brasiliensis]